MQKLERQAAESREQAQQEVVSLQDVHHNKVATLKKRHKEEVTQLKSQLSSLEQQLGDGNSLSLAEFLVLCWTWLVMCVVGFLLLILFLFCFVWKAQSAVVVVNLFLIVEFLV